MAKRDDTNRRLEPVQETINFDQVHSQLTISQQNYLHDKKDLYKKFYYLTDINKRNPRVIYHVVKGYIDYNGGGNYLSPEQYYLNDIEGDYSTRKEWFQASHVTSSYVPVVDQAPPANLGSITLCSNHNGLGWLYLVVGVIGYYLKYCSDFIFKNSKH